MQTRYSVQYNICVKVFPLDGANREHTSQFDPK